MLLAADNDDDDDDIASPAALAADRIGGIIDSAESDGVTLTDDSCKSEDDGGDCDWGAI